MAQTKHPL